MKQDDQTVVRVKTSAWFDGNTLHSKRSVRILRRQTHGHCIIEEDIRCVGADEAYASIENISTVSDGVYRLLFVPGSTDWESGHLNDWTYRLVPND